jgi:hypothetical protein
LNKDKLALMYRGKLVARVIPADMRIHESGKWYCLPIIAQRHHSSCFTEIWGLVLERSGQLGQYRRVGLFTSSTVFNEYSELSERPSYRWEPSSMRVKFTPNVSREDSFPDQTSAPELDDLGEEGDEWVESVISNV